MARNWLFFYLKTGGGHLSPARALKDSVESQHGGEVNVHLVDGLEGAIKPAHWVIEDGYRVSINYAKWIFEMLYAFNKVEFFGQLSNKMVAWVSNEIVKEQISLHQPDQIVVFHYFLIQPVYDTLAALGMDIPVTVVVTDPYTAHPIWFLNKRPDFIVFSPQLKEQLIDKGLNPEKVHHFPQIIQPRFEKQTDTATRNIWMKKHGLVPGRKTILIFGGGDGLKNGHLVLKKLTRLSVPANVIIVCGRNLVMYQLAQKIAESPGRAHIKVFGFVDFMHELLGVAHIVISKCGASALAEILISKKIPVVIDYIWEQEKGNVDFILENRLGFYQPNPAKVLVLVEELLTDDQLLSSYQKRIENLNYRNGVYDIADFLMH